MELASLESQVRVLNPNRLLIVDDDPDVLGFLGEVGRHCRYDVALSGSISALYEIYDSFDPSTMIVDLKLDHGDAIDVMSFLEQHGCQAPILLVSGFDLRVLESARRIGLSRGLTIAGTSMKPVAFDTVEAFLERHREPDYDEWAIDLQLALTRNEFLVHYQPKVRISDGAVVGVEARTRWTHPSRGSISPSRFIPVAESTGLIAPLTDFVLTQAAADGAGWLAAGYPLTVAVNISPLLLSRPTFLDDIVRAIDASGFPATALALEIVESAALRKSASVLEVLSRLRLRGMTLSLDDFGSGFANFDILTQLPINELKIDRSVITNVESSRDNQIILRAISDLAQQLGLTTVAEGVEHLDTCRWLASINIDQVQGYAIAHPMPADELRSWIDSWPSTPLA